MKSFKEYILEKTNGGGDDGALPPGTPGSPLHGPPAPAHDQHVRDHIWDLRQQAEQDAIDAWNDWIDGLNGRWPPPFNYPTMPRWPRTVDPLPRYQDWYNREVRGIDPWSDDAWRTPEDPYLGPWA